MKITTELVNWMRGYPGAVRIAMHPYALAAIEETTPNIQRIPKSHDQADGFAADAYHYLGELLVDVNTTHAEEMISFYDEKGALLSVLMLVTDPVAVKRCVQ